MYVLTENGSPIRKAHTAADAWSGRHTVAGHPTDSEGMCVFEDGCTLGVSEYPLGTDVWRVVEYVGGYSYFYGTARELRKEYGLCQADRLNWDGTWEVVYA